MLSSRDFEKALQSGCVETENDDAVDIELPRLLDFLSKCTALLLLMRRQFCLKVWFKTMPSFFNRILFLLGIFAKSVFWNVSSFRWDKKPLTIRSLSVSLILPLISIWFSKNSSIKMHFISICFVRNFEKQKYSAKRRNFT